MTLSKKNKEYLMKKLKLTILGCATLALLSTAALAESNERYYYNNGKKVYLTPLKVEKQESGTTRAYKSERVTKTVVNNRVFFKMKEGADKSILKGLKTEHVMGEMYKITVSSEEEALSVANRLYESNQTEFAQPDIEQKMSWR